MNFDSDKIILFPFPAYAGGKFLMNCLALSKNAVFSHADIALKDLYLKDTNASNYYDWKLESALKSLPKSDEQVKDWRNHEIYGNSPLFYCEFITQPKSEILSDAVKIMSNRNDTNFFCEYHTIDGILTLKKNYYKNAKILTINDYKFFIEVAYNKKTKDGNFRKNKHMLKSISTFERDKQNLNVDYCISYKNIFDENLFLPELKNLYLQMGYNDFNEKIISIFYKKYISFHI